MSDELLGSLELEFLINNPELLAQLKQAEEGVQGATANIETSVAKASAAISKLQTKGGFSSSIAEVEAYSDSLMGIGDSGRVAVGGMDELIRALNLDLENGTITAEQFKNEVLAITTAHEEWAAAIKTDTVAQEEQLGILKRLQVQLAELKEARPGLTNVAEIEKANAQIAAYGAEIKRLESLGTEAFNKLGVSVEKPIGQIGRLQYAAKLYEQQIVSSTNPDIISKYNVKLESAQLEINRLRNVGKSGFDELGNAVGKSTNLLGGLWSKLRLAAAILPGIGIAGILAFAAGPIIEYIAKLGLFSNKLTQAVANLKALNEVQATADKAAGTQISNLKILYAAATDVNNSIEDRTKAARELQKEFPETFSNSKILAILNGEEKKSYDELTKSVLDNARAKAAAGKIAEIEGQQLDRDFTRQKIRNVQAAETQRSINFYAKSIKSGDPSISDAEARRRASIPTLSQANYDAGAKTIGPNDPGGINGELNAINKRANDALKVLDAGDKIAKNTVKFLTSFVGGNAALANGIDAKGAGQDAEAAAKKAAALAKQLADQDAASLKAKLALLQQVTDATETLNRKALTSDQAAIVAISDRFDQLRQKISAFNADPKNKNNKIGQETIDSLNPAERTAINNQANLNENAYIKQDIEEKKKLYADYEAYKKKAGSAAANAEYADLLLSGKDFATYLDNIKKAVDSNDLSGPIEQRREMIQKDIDGNLQEQKKAFEQLLEQNITYQQQRQAIIETGIENENKLRAAGYADQAAQSVKNTEDQLTALDEAQIKKLDAWKDLFDGVHNLSHAQAKKDIAAIQAFIDAALKAGTITKEAYEAINKQLNDQRTKSDLPEELAAIGAGLSGISSQAAAFDENLGKALSTAGSLISATASIKGNLSTLSSGASSVTDKISAGFALVGTAISVVTTIVGLFDHSKEAAEQQKYTNDLQLKATEAINKELERQLKLTEAIYGPERITAYNKQLKDITAAEDAANEKLKGRYGLTTGVKFIDDEIAARNNGARGNSIYDGIIQGVKALGQAVDLSVLPIEKLNKLLDEGKLDQNTAAIVQSLIDLQQQAIDTRNALNETLTGTTFDSLLDGILNLFSDTTTAAEDWGNNFTKIIQTALLNSFKADFLAPEIQKLYNYIAQLTQDDGGTLTKDSIVKIKAMYDGIVADGEKNIQNIEAATGVSFNDPTAPGSSAGSLKGAIKGITEDQANVLEGAVRGIQLAVVKSNDLLAEHGSMMQAQQVEMQKQTLIQMQIAANTKRTADNTDTLPEMRDSLKSIDKNTGDTTTSVLRGFGLTRI